MITELEFVALDVELGMRRLREGLAGAGEAARVRWLMLDAAAKQAALAAGIATFVTILDLMKARALSRRG